MATGGEAIVGVAAAKAGAAAVGAGTFWASSATGLGFGVGLGLGLGLGILGPMVLAGLLGVVATSIQRRREVRSYDGWVSPRSGR